MAANRGYAPLPTESKSVMLLLHQFAILIKAQSYLDTALWLPHIFMLVKSVVRFVAFPYLKLASLMGIGPHPSLQSTAMNRFVRLLSLADTTYIYC